MATSGPGDGGKTNFADTGGYGQFNSSGGGLYNTSASAGGNPTTMSGGVGDYGMKQAAASRLGQPASSMNAAANQAMKDAGYQLQANGVWGKPPDPGTVKSITSNPYQPSVAPPPPAIVQNPLATIPKPPQVQNPWNSWYGALDSAFGYNPPVGGMPPTGYSPTGFHTPPNNNYNLNSPFQGGGGAYNPNNAPLPGGGGTIGGMAPNSTLNSKSNYGGETRPGVPRGFADGGMALPGELAVVGERGPEWLEAGAGGARVMPMGDSGFDALIDAITARQRVNVNRNARGWR